MTLPLGGGHAAQMRHFCRSYEFQLPTQPSSMSPPLPPPSTVQFSTLGPGGRHVYCNIPMTLLNGQVGEKTGPLITVFIFLFCSCLFQASNIHTVYPFFECSMLVFMCMFSESKHIKIKPLFSPQGFRAVHWGTRGLFG